jgi:hypothetical protein
MVFSRKPSMRTMSPVNTTLSCPCFGHISCVCEFLWYHGTMVQPNATYIVERIQTGVRIEKRLLKVLKALAEYRDLSLGDLLEGIVLHAFEGKSPFEAETLSRIRELKKFYGLDLGATASHKLREASSANSERRRKRR